MTRRPPDVKICGLTRASDAVLASDAGADHGGVILARGHGRTISPEDARIVFAGTPLRRVGVFVDPAEDEVLHAVEVVGLDVAQLHGDESPELAEALRGAGVTVWKAIRPDSAESFRSALARYAGRVDAILLDGVSSTAAGGTGARFPWRAVADARREVPPDLEIVVAGGLTPGNVEEAIRLLAPRRVDVSSGVERSIGIKDPSLVRAFVARARSAVVEGPIDD